jgi:hypothetical protein
VADRYQSADAFAADLDRLLVSYRFDPSELRELLRSLFRSDYAKEEEDLRACRTSLPADERRAATETPLPAPPATTASADFTPSGPTPSEDERRGFWAKIRSKFSKS